MCEFLIYSILVAAECLMAPSQDHVGVTAPMIRVNFELDIVSNPESEIDALLRSFGEQRGRKSEVPVARAVIKDDSLFCFARRWSAGERFRNTRLRTNLSRNQKSRSPVPLEKIYELESSIMDTRLLLFVYPLGEESGPSVICQHI